MRRNTHTLSSSGREFSSTQYSISISTTRQHRYSDRCCQHQYVSASSSGELSYSLSKVSPHCSARPVSSHSPPTHSTASYQERQFPQSSHSARLQSSRRTCSYRSYYRELSGCPYPTRARNHKSHTGRVSISAFRRTNDSATSVYTATSSRSRFNVLADRRCKYTRNVCPPLLCGSFSRRQHFEDQLSGKTNCRINHLSTERSRSYFQRTNTWHRPEHSNHSNRVHDPVFKQLQYQFHQREASPLEKSSRAAQRRGSFQWYLAPRSLSRDRMISSHWEGDSFPSHTQRNRYPMEHQYSRPKRLRTPMENSEDFNGRPGISSREKRHRWMTPDELDRQGDSQDQYSLKKYHQSTTWSSPRSTVRIHYPPPPPLYSSRCMSRDNLPPSSDPYCSSPTRHSIYDHRKYGSPRQRRPYVPSPTERLSLIHLKDCDKHRRSRRPSPWRRAPLYLGGFQNRRKGRAGKIDHSSWKSEYHQRDEQRRRDGFVPHHPPSGSASTWRSTFRDSHYGEQTANDFGHSNRHKQQPWYKRGGLPPPTGDKDKRQWKRRDFTPSSSRKAHPISRENKQRYQGDNEIHKPRSLSGHSVIKVQSPKKQKTAKNDDEIVHFEWLPGMKLSRRFVVISQLGEGTFGRVVECQDVETGQRVAVKVVRDISRYTSAAQIEAEILEEIREKDTDNRSNCVVLIKRFLYDRRKRRERRMASLRRQRRQSRQRSGHCESDTSSVDRPVHHHRHHPHTSGDESTTRTSSDEDYYGAGIHMCLVSEKLGLSLFAFLSQNQYRGFFVEDIQRISSEVLRALAFLRKPENILFVDDAVDRVAFPRSRYPSRFWDGDASDLSEDDDATQTTPVEVVHSKPVSTNRPRDCRVKLIDFGSATFEDDSHCSLINTRQYRAPEVILQIGWSTPSDMWCLGCILMELYTGVLLFRTHEHLEHLALIERIIGPIPQSVLQAASCTGGAKYILKETTGDKRLRLDWPEGASSQKSIEKVKKSRPLDDMVLPCHRLFSDFVRYLLQVDPTRRPTPPEAMNHPFLRTVLPEC